MTAVQKPDRKAFKKRAYAAAHDADLSIALERALPAFGKKREAAFEGQDFPGKRRKVHDLKADAIARLPELVEQFITEAETAGVNVHQATTIEDAQRIVLDIARQHQAKLIVKSKSMVSEEIHLNHALEDAGIRVVETDLGEYLIQLAGDRPSHLIAPAIHITREQAAALLSAEAGEELPSDVQNLVAFARKQLRQDFINADIGISGANVAIADSGTLVIVENEGNGRLVTTLPPVHIAILGVEKIVPSLEDATAILQALPRSGTGQKITSYVSYITGPSRTADIELTMATGVHGPNEVHVVLLDNGRWKTREDEQLHEALHCIRCGACSNVCPPYQVVGGHVFGHIYSGPIGLIMTAMHHGLENAAGPQSLCLSCNACEMVCPAEIPIPRLILDVRARSVEAFGLPRIKEMAMNRWTDPKRGDRWASLAGRASRLLADGEGVIRSIPMAGDLTAGRALKAPAKESLSKSVAKHGLPQAATLPSSKAAGLRVAYFPGCMTDRLGPKTGQATLKVLQACGCDVVLPERQHCCGLVALNMGDRDHGRRMARQTIEMLEGVEADWIITTTTSCEAAIVQDYHHLFAHDPEWQERAHRQAQRMTDFTSFLANIAQPDAADFQPPAVSSVTYHDACQSHNALGLGAAARRIITEMLGIELKEMENSNVCCGFGGSFSMDYPAISTTILGKKLRTVEATEAPTVVSDNPGCLMQISGGLTATGSPITTLHIAELVAQQLPCTLSLIEGNTATS